MPTSARSSVALGLILGGVLGPIAGTGRGAAKELPIKGLAVYRVQGLLKLDGRRDDPCWATATPTGDFEMYAGKGMPRNRTRAWVAYDWQNLYLFFECFDRDMAKTVGKRPQDTIDESIWQEEEIEIFFDVNHDRKTYFQLMCSILGTQCDMASVVGQAWHGGRDKPGRGWRAKTRRDDKAWYAELAIPFTVLRRTTELAATPQPGTVWGANFCRHEYRENEWINWNVATRGFHQPSRFGQLRFMGFRDRKTPVVERIEGGTLDFGKRSVRIHVQNPTNSRVVIAADLDLRRGADRVRPLTKRTAALAPGKSHRFELPYEIFDGGDWEARVRVMAGDGTLLAGEASRRLPLIRKTLAKLADAGRTGARTLAASAFPDRIKSALGAKLKSLEISARAYAKQLRKPDALKPAEWDAIRKGVPALEADSVEALKRLAYVEADNARAGTGSRTGLLLAVHGPLVHVFTDTTAGADTTKPVRLTAMAGEAESFQVAVMALWQELSDVRVSTAALVGPGGRITGDDFKAFLVAYQRSYRRPIDPPGTREWYPDVLLPVTARTVAPFMTQPYWIDVCVPRGTKPGLYKGRAVVTAKGKAPQHVPVELTVRNHALPPVPLLHNDFWITTHGPRWWGYPTTSIPKMSELFRIAQRNRISAMPSFWIEIYFKLKITRVGPERYTFDFTEFNKYLLADKKFGVNRWNPNLECNQGWASYFSGGYGAAKITDSKTGKEYEFANRYKKKTIPLKVLWTGTPIFEQFWKAYVKNLKTIGMLETAWYESVDEPNDMPRMDLLILIHTQLKTWVPEMKLMSWGTYPAHHYARARGYVHAWAPQLGWYWDVREIMQRDQKQNGITQYIYTCGGQARNDKGGYTPDGFVRDPNITRRIVPWMCHKWGIRGYLFFAMNVWPQRSSKTATILPAEKQPWPTVVQFSKTPVYNLVRPGPNKTFLPTIRLKAFRDGMDDYDYLKTLEQLTARLKRRRQAAALVAEAERLLLVEDALVKDPCTYTLDAAVLGKRRQQIGDLIERAAQALNAK